MAGYSFLLKLPFMAFIAVAVVFSSCKKNERALVVGKIQNASDLATTEFVIDKIVFGTKTKNWHC